MFAQIELFVTGTPAADHGVVRDYAAAFVDISRLGASRRFSFGSGRIRLKPAAGAARLMRDRGSLAGSALAAGFRSAPAASA